MAVTHNLNVIGAALRGLERMGCPASGRCSNLGQACCPARTGNSFFTVTSNCSQGRLDTSDELYGALAEGPEFCLDDRASQTKVKRRLQALDQEVDKHPNLQR